MHRIFTSAVLVLAQSPLALAEDTLTAEPQVPTGRFTTALEVRPILTATQANWVAVREFDGADLVYVTQILAWRCGLLRLRWGVNGEGMQNWPLPPCEEASAQPNALPANALPYVRLPRGSVRTVEVEIVYDDLTEDGASFDRAAVLMP
ncbi:MAG: hypothetical protein HLUCCA24_01900 [Rhodobacteraceae bacterium HLUCCA24]|nr:MAG: hypothetical protein HLUCCA24_01900 [Rhodobacteraceae bacterium HLUCCA24]